MVLKESHKLALAAIGLTALYFLTGKLGLMLAFEHPSATAVWPPTGIALAAFLLFGYEVWPGVLIGAFLVNVTTAGSVPVCLAIAVGNTLEGLAGAYLVNKRAGGPKFINRTEDVLSFAVLAGICSTMIGATIGVTSLTLGGYASWVHYRSIWSTWWLGDATGALVLTPLILLWISNPRLRWRWRQFLEALVLLVYLVIVGLMIFGALSVGGQKNYPLEYLCIPFLMWAAFRFGPREAMTAMLILSGIAIWGTFHGYGPFALVMRGESFFFLQAFIGVVAIMTLLLAVLFAEHQRAELQARALAVSDPLTGLGNYRKLMETLEQEIKRSDRTARSFALLLLDLDGLKRINDTYGHLAGSRALCRLAQVLRNHCRSIDTAVRHGGDEFALIIPEVDDGAGQVAHRITERLARDGETPPLSVSIGAAIWPRDGETLEQLFRSADRALYEDKRRHHLA
jgi:diguanylate cyclase (GGDEF)-like protein